MIYTISSVSEKFAKYNERYKKTIYIKENNVKLETIASSTLECWLESYLNKR